MKNIIFDWSGVVRDTLTSQLWIVNKIFDTYGVNTMTSEEFKENWEQPYILFYQKYLPKDYSEEERVKIYREAVFNKDGPKSSAFAGMKDLIKRCKANGMFIAVVSSDIQETLHSEIKAYGLENIFNEIITDSDDKFEPVQKIIKNNDLNPEETYFIGDSNHEIDVAKKANIKSIAVTWGFTSERKLRIRNPDYIVNNPQELESIIFNERIIDGDTVQIIMGEPIEMLRARNALRIAGKHVGVLKNGAGFEAYVKEKYGKK